MERNKLNEIRKIKNLINLLENKDSFINETSDEDCKKQLEDSGFTVYGVGFKEEESQFLEKCKYKENLIKIVDILNKDNKKYDLDVQNKNCYLIIKSKNYMNNYCDTTTEVTDNNECYIDGKYYKFVNLISLGIPKYSVTFFGDGDVIVSYGLSDEIVEKHSTITIGGKEMAGFTKSILYGTYEISGDDIKLNDLKPMYMMSYDENGDNKTVKTISLPSETQEVLKNDNAINNFKTYSNFKVEF